ncbi:4-hydroxy-tetrahydrodipicolinate reductase [Buchnera aphidicola (Eriosoma lanigerum)]|uniref:4-hydroxy-tetrahydrodipicolinate reductase n=1 Tax=Buchnera aphidicola TaxID=9 RepID=UPI003464094B
MIIQPLKIAISGALGRMGKILIQEIKKNKQLKLTTAISHNQYINNSEKNPQLIDVDIPIKNYLKESNADFDILIDFSHPKYISEYIQYCIEHKKKIVIGTTGYNKQEENIIKKASKKIGIVFSYNFSIGMNVLYKLIENTTKIIGNNSEIAIIESHHNKKIDIPSGTSITIKKIINNNLSENNQKLKKNDYNEIQKEKKIEILSLRMGDLPGEHTIIYSHQGEQLEITHKAQDRTIFANGAIQSAMWLHLNNNAGLFNMQNVLEKKI